MGSLKDKLQTWKGGLLNLATEKPRLPALKRKAQNRVHRFEKEVVQLAAENPVRLAFYVFLVAAFFILFSSLPLWLFKFKDFYENVMVEAHGLVFDLFVIGCIVFSLQKRGERIQRIQRYNKELESYLPWQEPEATSRITGLIRRLNDEKIEDINLPGAYLPGVTLTGVKLTGANLEGARFARADLCLAILARAHLRGANFKGAHLSVANLTGADLSHAKFAEAFLFRAKLIGANLAGANFSGAILQEADLTRVRHEGPKNPPWYTGGKTIPPKRTVLMNTDLKDANLEGADFTNTSFRGAKNLTIDQLCTAKTLYNAKLDPELETQAKEKCPHLLKPNEGETL